MTSVQVRALGPITNRRMVMSVLGMRPRQIPAPVEGAINRLAAKRRAKGEAFGGPRPSLAQPSGADRAGRGPRLLSQIRGRASARRLSVHRAKRGTGDWRRLRVMPSCPARAGRRIASVPHRRHRRALEQEFRQPQRTAARHHVEGVGCGRRSLTRCKSELSPRSRGKDGLVEIVVISGFYQMFAAINQGFDIVPSGKGPPPATT